VRFASTPIVGANVTTLKAFFQLIGRISVILEGMIVIFK
jgi:hypothetical protein